MHFKFISYRLLHSTQRNRINVLYTLIENAQGYNQFIWLQTKHNYNNHILTGSWPFLNVDFKKPVLTARYPLQSIDYANE